MSSPDLKEKSQTQSQPTETYDASGDTEYNEVNASGHGKQVKLQRQLKNRHIAMIRYLASSPRAWQPRLILCASSIGGVIGTGLFLGTAGSLRNGGPIGLLLGYAIIGTITYSVMVSHVYLRSNLPCEQTFSPRSCLQISLGEMVCIALVQRRDFTQLPSVGFVLANSWRSHQIG
jgi:amino acid permease